VGEFSSTERPDRREREGWPAAPSTRKAKTLAVLGRDGREHPGCVIAVDN